MDYDLILERSRESTFRNWIGKVRVEDVTRLAAKYRPDQPQCLLESAFEGSFNRCYKVVFTDGLQWVVRVPVPGRSMYLEEKLLREVAAIKYIKSHTSIPIPDIIAFGSAEDNVGGFGPFMITEFVVGDNVGVKLFDSNVDQDFEESMYRQIAGFLLQLANCKFDTIGSLFMDSHNGQPTWSVRGKPLTLSINETLKGGGVNLYSNTSETCTSTAQYFLEIAEQKSVQLLEQRNSIDNREDAIKKLKHRRLFKSITPQFICNELNDGPFTLVCDDFRPGNMLFRDGKIVAVLDWEWTYAGPLELLLSPPRWFYKEWPSGWDADQRAGYSAKFEKFVGILEEEEMKIVNSGCLAMSKLMKESWNQSGKFEYDQLLGEVFMFDDSWLWERIEVDYASFLQDSLEDDTSIVERKWRDYLDYVFAVSPIRVFDYLRGLKGSPTSTRCSFCWACLHPDWMGHDISDCIQLPYDDSTVSVPEAVATCRSRFHYIESLDIHPACGAPYYFGCDDKHCSYQMIAYSVYIAATGKASHLHYEARKTFSEHYDIDIEKSSPEELTAVMARPHKLGLGTVSALVWFIDLIHDKVERPFQWYSENRT